ncbi:MULTISPECIES: hypothetical protein [unclassified Stenotrophomonas maltophilia group]|uniref:hypothetical protein n=1 Tax=unclassified Stenotrophomonas maltophilia group TaxID=2961925 RepID=UPI00131ED790|nr:MULTISPECIES: hypothetical protein [unclassified Stenotrophomonas maltophilia group]
MEVDLFRIRKLAATPFDPESHHEVKPLVIGLIRKIFNKEITPQHLARDDEMLLTAVYVQSMAAVKALSLSGVPYNTYEPFSDVEIIWANLDGWTVIGGWAHPQTKTVVLITNDTYRAELEAIMSSVDKKYLGHVVHLVDIRTQTFDQFVITPPNHQFAGIPEKHRRILLARETVSVIFDPDARETNHQATETAISAIRPILSGAMSEHEADSADDPIWKVAMAYARAAASLLQFNGVNFEPVKVFSYLKPIMGDFRGAQVVSGFIYEPNMSFVLITNYSDNEERKAFLEPLNFERMTGDALFIDVDTRSLRHFQSCADAMNSFDGLSDAGEGEGESWVNETMGLLVEQLIGSEVDDEEATALFETLSPHFMIFAKVLGEDDEGYGVSEGLLKNVTKAAINQVRNEFDFDLDDITEVVGGFMRMAIAMYPYDLSDWQCDVRAFGVIAWDSGRGDIAIYCHDDDQSKVFMQNSILEISEQFRSSRPSAAHVMSVKVH